MKKENIELVKLELKIQKKEAKVQELKEKLHDKQQIESLEQTIDNNYQAWDDILGDIWKLWRQTGDEKLEELYQKYLEYKEIPF